MPDAQKRFEDVCMAVLTKAAEGGSMTDVVELVGDWMDGCDCVDDESLVVFQRAKEAAEAPQPKVLFAGRLYEYLDHGGPIVKVAGDPAEGVRMPDLLDADVLVVEAPASKEPDDGR